jgi:triacylglycerol esterase/lipase EstA (alpha/beta hydrolase family)
MRSSRPGYKRGMRTSRLVAMLVAGLALLAAGPASARDFAPVDRPGPPLSVPAAELAKAFACRGDLAGASATPVLLVPGTGLTPQSNFSWNYERAFDARGIPWCSIELPGAATGDVQIAGEYVVYAIRQMNSMSGRKIDVLGFSQGGMVPRWAFRFWPDTRAMVDDDIGLDASNHGTLDSQYCDVTRRCPAAFWQQRASANFIRALNSFQETFAGVSYTEIYSAADEVVTPNLNDSGSSSLHTGDGQIANARVQNICPTDTSDHLAMGSYDAVGYALALDAMTHAGPADASRVDRSVCTQPFQPGVNPATFATDYAAYLAAAGNGVTRARQVSAEPRLACYVYADCPTG